MKPGKRFRHLIIVVYEGVDKLSNLSVNSPIEIIQFLRKDITKWASEVRKNILIVSFSSRFPRCIVQKVTHLYGCLSCGYTYQDLGGGCWRVTCVEWSRNCSEIDLNNPFISQIWCQPKENPVLLLTYLECHTSPPQRNYVGLNVICGKSKGSWV